MKDYGKVKAFRLQAAEETKLEECFDWLQVSGDNFNQRMNDFIVKVYTILRQNTGRHKSAAAPAFSKGPVRPQTPSTVPQKTAEYLGCPLRDDWVRKEDCDKCRVTNFPAWSDCYQRRHKNPDDPIFKISKRKPGAAS
ncbi:MAG: hypothetical protein OEY47_06685 [Candidatus Bathyarchaeota archaeon]|nr:hypothetical protein [Candidatus Bathyarchaeota archaeon]